MAELAAIVAQRLWNGGTATVWWCTVNLHILLKHLQIYTILLI
jgi:hypothetical protein